MSDQIFPWLTVRIGEKFHQWSDVTPSDETIIEFITLYWITNTIERCLYPYREVCPQFFPFPHLIRHINPTSQTIPSKIPFPPTKSSQIFTTNQPLTLPPLLRYDQNFPNGVATLTGVLSDAPPPPEPESTPIGSKKEQISPYYVDKPMGVSSFPKELAVSPESWLASQGNLVFYRRHDKVSLYLSSQPPLKYTPP